RIKTDEALVITHANRLGERAFIKGLLSFYISISRGLALLLGPASVTAVQKGKLLPIRKQIKTSSDSSRIPILNLWDHKAWQEEIDALYDAELYAICCVALQRMGITTASFSNSKPDVS